MRLLKIIYNAIPNIMNRYWQHGNQNQAIIYNHLNYDGGILAAL